MPTYRREPAARRRLLTRLALPAAATIMLLTGTPHPASAAVGVRLTANGVNVRTCGSSLTSCQVRGQANAQVLQADGMHAGVSVNGNNLWIHVVGVQTVANGRQTGWISNAYMNACPAVPTRGW